MALIKEAEVNTNNKDFATVITKEPEGGHDPFDGEMGN